jgi:hypothetical protein
MARTIKAKKYTNVIEEYEANAAITPGMLIELMSTGKVRAHAGEGQNALPMFALENELEGEGVDDDFAAGDLVQCWIPNRGDIVNARISNGENIAIGDFLESNGDGYLQKHTADVDSSADITTIYPLQIVGQATEACDMSGSSGVDPAGGFCAVRII